MFVAQKYTPTLLYEQPSFTIKMEWITQIARLVIL